MKQFVLCLLVAFTAIFAPQKAMAILTMPTNAVATISAQPTTPQNMVKKSFLSRAAEKFMQTSIAKKLDVRAASLKEMMGNNLFRLGAILAIVGLIVSILLSGLLGRLGSLSLAVGLVMMVLVWLEVI
jgi:hypothetical protein